MTVRMMTMGMMNKSKRHRVPLVRCALDNNALLDLEKNIAKN